MKNLKYNTEADVERREFKFSKYEEELYKINNLEHNTIDILNENLKLKELLKYLTSNFMCDLEKIKK